MEIFAQIKDWVLPHWPFFAAVLVIYSCGLVAKKVWTKQKADKSKFFWWMRATLPVHPLIAGAVIGVAIRWAPGIDKFGLVVLYYMAAGGSASWVVNIFKHFLRSKGVKIPAESQPPPKGE